ncbi:PREDICTED: putative disease resistance protein RGA4-like [Fragaria vesca subsp. vesca]
MAVGEIFLAAFHRILLDWLTSQAGYFGSLGGVGKKLHKWRETLSAVAAVLYDAEEKELTSKTVELWLNDLKHLAYDLEDLLNTFSNEMLERQLLKVDKSGTSKKEKLGLKYIVHTYTSTSPWQRIPGSYVLDGPVVGRDEDTAKIVELLSRDVDPSSPTQYQVVAIVGMGGLGKTTLVAQVFNDVAAIEQFDIKIWVSVSADFNLESVTRTISKKVKSQPCDTDDFCQLQDNLRKDIDGKRFLIVLDDVWSTCDYDSWTKLQAPFRGGAHGSKVMVTTRDEK